MFERCLYFNTQTLARKLNALWMDAFAPFDLAPSHAYLLRLVLETPGVTQQQLANELCLNKSTVTRFVAALENKALVERVGSGKDQREKSVVPSPEAIAIGQDLEAKGAELYSTMCGAIGRDKVEAFVQAAREINQKL